MGQLKHDFFYFKKYHVAKNMKTKRKMTEYLTIFF